MWLIMGFFAVVAFWVLNIYFRDDGTKLKHSPVIDGPDDQKNHSKLTNLLTWIVALGLVGAMLFVFGLNPSP